MRITTFDHEQGEFCGMDVPLRRLAALPDPLKAAYWKMLLDLVTHLQSSDSEYELQGLVAANQLHFYETEPANSVRNSQIRQFMIDWRTKHPDSIDNSQLRNEIQSRFPRERNVHLEVWVDWKDYGPIENGVPKMHFRVRATRAGNITFEDARAKDIAEAEEFIRKVIGW